VAATVTDAGGEFRFEGLAAGDYHVIATPPNGPAVNAATFGIPLPTGDPKADEAAFEAMRRESDASSVVAEVSVDGLNSATVEVRIKRSTEVGGAVFGRVVYPDGKPAAGAQVVFIRSGGTEGRLLGPTRLSAVTDASGRYRLDGLPPGNYLVRARMQETIYRDQHGRTYGGLVLRTYYPSATSATAAAPVSVAVGGELGGVDITLVKRAVHTLGGTLLARGGGRPLAGVHVRLRAREDVDLPFTTGEDDRFTWTDAQGRFAFDNVMDGDYVLAFGGATAATIATTSPPLGRLPSAPGQPPRLSRGTPLSDRLPRAGARGIVETRREVTVAGADVRDLSIEVSAGGRVSGVVVVEGGGPLPARMLVTSEMQPGERRPGALAQVKPDGTFILEGLPEGPLRLNALISPPQGYYLKTVLVGGADTAGAPIYVADGAELSDVRVVLSTQVVTLTGRVLSPDGAPLSGATVMLVAEEQLETNPRGNRLIAVTDSNGRFGLRAGPGQYRAVVWKGLPPASAEELQALAQAAQRVTLSEGARNEVELVAPAAR
jgi:hypothetical protein